MTARLIDQVLGDLDLVIAQAREEGSRLGYFAALYRRVTAKVKEGIETPGVFEDPERMDLLDFNFASRYLEALQRFQAGRPVTRAWRRAFEAATSFRPIILQHLVLGINAHVNLDLGIAAARTAPAAGFAALRDDFGTINSILSSLIGLVERQLGEVSPWMALLARVAGHHGVRAVEFSLDIARDEAWRFGQRLAPLTEPDQVPEIDRRDGEVIKLAGKVLHPGPLVDLALLVVRMREVASVRRVIDILDQRDDPPVERMVAEGMASEEMASEEMASEGTVTEGTPTDN